MKALATFLLLAVLGVPATSIAAERTIVVSSPWLRATPKGAPVAGGYATITNKGPSADRLIGAKLAVAPRGEIHSMTMNGAAMHMEKMDGLAIPPGKSVVLAPGGYHLMFLQPTAQLKEGQMIAGALTFEKAGSIDVMFPVAGMAARSAPAAPGKAREIETMPGMKMP